MGYITRTEVRTAFLQRGPDVALKELRTVVASATTTVFDIFLSHSFRDAGTVAGIKAFLEQQGLRVYVDWIEDAELERASVNRHTAQRLRERMRNSKSLLFATSESSPDSRWRPWELGFFDGHKPEHVAILPLVTNSNDGFVGQEYLSLYPEVQWVYLNGRRRLHVLYRGVPMLLSSFVNRPVIK